MPRQVLTLVACHSLEDLPVHLTGAEAQSLLSGLVCGWHPGLIAACGRIPGWCRVDSTPDDLRGLARVVPTSSERSLPTGLSERVQAQDGLVLRPIADRREAAGKLLEFWGLESPADLAESQPGVDDFFALGYVYWQVQLMTRNLRYASQLDAAYLSELVVAAAQAHIRRESNVCQEKLQAAFDLLAQERCRYFPIDPQFIDLVLIAESTLGASLRQELAVGQPQSILLTGELLERLARQNPSALELLRERVAAGTIELVGGCQRELPWPCLDSESLGRQFRQGSRTFARLIDQVPLVFGRRTRGLISDTPQFLAGYGFRCAVHATFDGGHVPQSVHSPAEWAAGDGSNLPAWMGIPIDAASPDAFLRLGISIGESLDSAHSSASLFAHWPGRICEWYGDLQRASRYGKVLGEFARLREYCQQGAFSGHRVHFDPDEYRADFLRQWQLQREPDPLSRWVDYAQVQGVARQVAWLDLLIDLTSAPAKSPTPRVSQSRPAGVPPTDGRVHQPLAGLLAQVDDVVMRPPETDAADGSTLSPITRIQSVLEQLQGWRGRLAEQFAHAVPKALGESAPALMLLNPLPLARRAVCAIPPNWEAIVESNAVVTSQIIAGQGGHAVVELPPAGYALLKASRVPARRKRRRGSSIVEGLTLRNEYFELTIDERTGGLRGLNLFERRGNLLSQQLGLRLAVPRAATAAGGDTLYSLTIARGIETLSNDEVVGRVRARGEMLAGDEVLATFTQTVTVARSRRIIELEIDLEIHRMPGNDPWRQYYCSRFAWADESAKLSGSLVEHRALFTQPRFESPRYVEIDSGLSRVALLCGGLPCHRKYDDRKLDTLLVVAGETRRRFRLGLAVNADIPLRAAQDFEFPPQVVELPAGTAPAQDSAWCLRVDSKNLLIAGIEGLGSRESPFAGGLDLRLVETEGRGGQARLECARSIARAVRVNLNGEELSQLSVAEGTVSFGFRPHEYFQLRIFWN